MGVESEIRVKFGGRGFAKAHDQGLWQAMDKKSERFAYLSQKYTQNSEAKMKEGIFVGPKIKQQFEDHNFRTKFNSTERRH